MAGPKGGKPPELTLGDMASVAGKIFLSEPMQRAGEAIKPIFEGVSAAQPPEERRAPALDSAPETGPAAQRNNNNEGARPTDGMAAALSGAGFGALTANAQRERMDNAIDAAVNGPSPPKPPGM